MSSEEGYKKRGIHFREDQFDRLNKISFDLGTSTQIVLSVIIDRFFRKINYQNYLKVKNKIEQQAYENLKKVHGDEVWTEAGLEELYKDIQKADVAYQDYKKEIKGKEAKK